MSPTVLVVGRTSPESKGVRGPAFAGGQTYFRALERAGAIPLLLPPMPGLVDRLPSLMDRIDGIVLHGGGDVDPSRYGEPPVDEVYGVVPEHDEVEFAVVRAALEADRPLLAICRGMQVLNVVLGGTLVQHIGNEDHWLRYHPVDVDAGSHLATALRSETADRCHSVHHQAVGRLGDRISLVAQAGDGTPEAIETDVARWVVGVQWHPEDSAADDSQQQGLFDALVARASR